MTYDGRWETVRVSAEEHIAWVELQRPEKRNAMKPKLSRSGGEWISSTELESHLARQPAVAEAAVIATVDEQWDERPLDVLVRAAGQHIDVDAVRSALAREVARWWGPERIEVLAGLPTTSGGKVDKQPLR